MVAFVFRVAIVECPLALGPVCCTVSPQMDEFLRMCPGRGTENAHRGPRVRNNATHRIPQNFGYNKHKYSPCYRLMSNNRHDFSHEGTIRYCAVV